MYYIEEKNDDLIKYEVILNREKLETLKYKVLIRCGQIKHHSYDSDYSPIGIPYDHIANYSYTEIGTKEYFEETRSLYHYEFDEYLDPKLVTLIDRLLAGDMSAIPEIKVPEKRRRKDNKKIELRKKITELLSVDIKKINTWELERLKEEIEDYQLHIELNKKQKSDNKYYPEVLSCIELKEVARCKKDTIAKIEELAKEMEPFFEGTNESNLYTNQYKKIYQ